MHMLGIRCHMLRWDGAAALVWYLEWCSHRILALGTWGGVIHIPQLILDGSPYFIEMRI